jgi:hypothetical protein
MTITYIRWKDAVAEEAASRSAVAKACLVELQEVGFVLDENDEAVEIGMEFHDTADVEPGRWRLHIPKVSIVERRDMELSKAFPVRKRKKQL